MAVDVHFQELLGWLNTRGGGPAFRPLNVLDRGNYGWAEFISARECRCPQELSRFYQRQGGFLAVLYALEATDFHCENLVAHGEHPMLLDLEALFHPRLDTPEIASADQAASNALCYSVLRVGLLPQRFTPTEEEQEIDMSGLGGAAGQLTPRGVPVWLDAGTDEMRLSHKRVAMAGVKNRPTLRGADVNPADYAAEIRSGFDAVYRTLQRHREELLLLSSRFADDEVRIIVRGTQTYAAILFESFHPHVLRDALDRDRFFERLRAAEDDYPCLKRLFEAERADLLRGDIPLFLTCPGSRDVLTSSNELIADFLSEPGMVSTQRRIQQLCDRDLEQQQWMIGASLSTLSPVVQASQTRTYTLSPAKVSVPPSQYLAAACAVGDRLEQLALRGNDGVSWIGLTHVNERDWCLTPLSAELYDGLPGVVLFLAYLGVITNKESYTALAKGALATLLGQLRNSRTHASFGAFTGLGGIIYLLTHLGALWQDSLLFRQAEDLAARVAELTPDDTRLDIIGGSAGCLLALSGLYVCLPSGQTLSAARQCGEHLLHTQQKTAHGIGWLPSGLGSKPLTGLAHGNAGIACALLQLTHWTGDSRFRSAALDAIAYERSLFSPTHGNWPDLRHSDLRFSMAWCHGAPGIGLARLRSLCWYSEPDVLTEIKVALRTTLTSGFGFNHSLCHGDAGNLDFLLEAGLTLADRRLLLDARRIASALVQQIGRSGWTCANPMRVESPGLMTGLAGIGYGMLRLAEPRRAPCILNLSPPILTASTNRGS